MPNAPLTPDGPPEQFRLLVESVRDYAIFMLDPEGHVRTWNAGAEAIKGYRADEIVGRSFTTFYTQPDRDRNHPQEELDIATREGRFEEEGWRVRKDGGTFWANVVITALRDEQGTLVGFAKVTRDLTERRASEERAVEDARRIRDAAAAVPGAEVVVVGGGLIGVEVASALATLGLLAARRGGARG